MPDYKKMYVKMAQASDDAVNAIAQGMELFRLASEKLKVARQVAEDMYTDTKDKPLELVKGQDEEKAE